MSRFQLNHFIRTTIGLLVDGIIDQKGSTWIKINQAVSRDIGQAPCYWKQNGHEVSAAYPGKKAMSGPKQENGRSLNAAGGWILEHCSVMVYLFGCFSIIFLLRCL